MSIIESNTLSKMGKILSWYFIANGFLAVIPSSIFYFTQSTAQLYLFEIALTFCIGLICLIAGYFCLKAKLWAFWLMLFTFLTQSVEFTYNSLKLSVIGTLYLKFGYGLASPNFRIYLNVIAIIVCILVIIVIRQLYTGSANAKNT